MPRVIHVLSSLDTGGVERRVIGQMPELQQRDDGLDHGLIALRGGRLADAARRTMDQAGVPLWVLDKGRGWDSTANQALGSAMEEFRPDLVTAYNFVAGLWTRLVARGRWGGTVVHEGGIRNAATWWGRTAEHFLRRWTRARIFNSQATRMIWETALGESPRHHVVLNGVSVTSAPRSRRNDGVTRLITVGRLVAIKGVDIQLETLARLIRRGRAVRLVVVGDGPQQHSLKNRAQDLGVADHVDWLGYRPDPEHELAAADIFLCTSYNETFSLTLCEAMAQELVCLAPRVGGPAEIIRHEVDGLLLPCRVKPSAELAAQLPSMVAEPDTGIVRAPLGIHPDDLAGAVEEVLDAGDDLRAMRESARERITTRFSRQRYVDDLAGCYQTILRGGGDS